MMAYENNRGSWVIESFPPDDPRVFQVLPRPRVRFVSTKGSKAVFNQSFTVHTYYNKDDARFKRDMLIWEAVFADWVFFWRELV